VITNVFKAMALREFYCEPRLADEFRAARWLAWLGRTVIRPAAKVIAAQFGVPPILVEITVNKIMTERVMIFPLRMASDQLAQWKSDTNNYQSCCRSALCYIVTNSHRFAFSVLQHAAWKNDDWARHHHIYGLIHGINGDYERAQFELGKALSTEPYPDVRQRTAEAIALAASGQQLARTPSVGSLVPSVLAGLPDVIWSILTLLEQSGPHPLASDS
jgi:hypothetical protein